MISRSNEYIRKLKIDNRIRTVRIEFEERRPEFKMPSHFYKNICNLGINVFCSNDTNCGNTNGNFS